MWVGEPIGTHTLDYLSSFVKQGRLSPYQGCPSLLVPPSVVHPPWFPSRLCPTPCAPPAVHCPGLLPPLCISCGALCQIAFSSNLPSRLLALCCCPSIVAVLCWVFQYCKLSTSQDLSRTQPKYTVKVQNYKSKKIQVAPKKTPEEIQHRCFKGLFKV